MPNTPIAIQLVTRSGCANCARAKDAVAATITAVANEHPLTVTEVNLSEHPELLEQHDIWTTPALIVNDELAFVGKVNERQLREKLAAIA